MADLYPIGDNTRRFYLAVAAVIAAALLLTSLGIGSLGALGMAGGAGSSGGNGGGAPLPSNLTVTTGDSQTTPPTESDPSTTSTDPAENTRNTVTRPPQIEEPTTENRTSSGDYPSGNNSTNIDSGNSSSLKLTESKYPAAIGSDGTLSIPDKNLTINPEGVPEHLSDGTEPQQTETPPPPYNLTVNPSSPTPGTNAIVFVTKNGQPVPSVLVTFNGKIIGTTGTHGAAIGTVPYSQTLTVSTETTTGETAESIGETIPPGAPTLQNDRVYALQLDTSQGDQGNVSVTLPKNVSIETDGALLPGRKATVTVTINETPLRGVTLWTADTQLGTTNANGVAKIRVPASLGQGDTITMEARRGTYTGHDTVQLSTVELNTSTSLPLNLPFSTANATVTADGEPINATFAVYPGTPETGDPHATIRHSHNLDFSLPLTQKVTVVAEVGAVRLTSPISGMLLHGGIVGFILLLTLSVSAWWARRNIDWARVRELPAIALDAIVRIGQYLGDITDHIIDRLRRLYTTLRTRPVEFLSKNLHPTSLIQRLHALFDALRQYLADLFGSRGESAITGTTGNSETTTHDNDTTSPTGSYRRLRAIWQWFVSLAITERRWSHLTITEVTQRGIDRGLPAKPVTQLRRALLDVEYGKRDPGQRLDETTTAASHIADTADTEPPETDNPNTKENNR